MKLGEKIPDFTLRDDKGTPFQIASLLGKKNLVIYFYPKDETPGCTKEACAFRDAYEDFQSAGAEVIGVSADSVESHQNFVNKRKLPFMLLSDEGNKVRQLFGVPKSFLGLLPGRVTYVIDKKGIVRHVFDSQTNIQGHISKALEVLKSLDS